jgi:hypothetical protein
MKVCKKCSAEFNGIDGVNTCNNCKRHKTKQAREVRKAREDILKDCGLVKVRGAMGGI